MSPTGDKIKTEGQARALLKVPKHKLEETVETAEAALPLAISCNQPMQSAAAIGA